MKDDIEEIIEDDTENEYSSSKLGKGLLIGGAIGAAVIFVGVAMFALSRNRSTYIPPANSGYTPPTPTYTPPTPPPTTASTYSYGGWKLPIITKPHQFQYISINEGRIKYKTNWEPFKQLNKVFLVGPLEDTYWYHFTRQIPL